MKRHFENLTNKVARAVKHWWLMLIAGLLSITLGIVIFVFPLQSYVTLAILFGVLMLVVGATQLAVAYMSGNYLAMRGYMIVGGALDLILGIFLCVYPNVTILIIPVLVGLWLMYHSFMIIAWGGDMETFNLGGSGLVIVGGILLLLFSIFILINPLSAGIATVVVLTGVGLIIFGVLTSVLALKLKNIHVEVGQ